MTKPSNPSNLAYNVYYPTESYNLDQLLYVMDPPCDYPYTESFTWTGLQSFITQDSQNTGRINVYTTDIVNA